MKKQIELKIDSSSLRTQLSKELNEIYNTDMTKKLIYIQYNKGSNSFVVAPWSYPYPQSQKDAF